MPEGDASTGSGTGQSTYMSNLVPTFDPAKDDLEQYTQKVELLAEIWPSEKYNELIARLILGTTGAAFQKLQLKKSELMSGTKAGVKTLIDLLGGQWGKVNLERKYEIVERALFKCTQRQDETNDSYLARSDVVWTELLSKGIDIAEVQAYILLRGSLLSSEDRKRVVLESEAEKSGALTVEKVSIAIRKLGATFFHEMIGTKKAKGKVYEPTALAEHVADDEENAYHAEDDLGEEDFVNQLLQQDDEDAALIADFEAAANDILQEDEDLAAAYSTYADARRRLSDRYKNRGFWPIGQKGRGKGHAGKGSKGKSFGKNNRKSLQQRIMETTCRICWKPGHWKAECPERNNPDYVQKGKGKGRSNSDGAPVSAAMTATVENSMEVSQDQVLPMEFMQLPVIHEPPLDEPGIQNVYVVNIEKGTVWDRIRNRGQFYKPRLPDKPADEPRNDDVPNPTGKDRDVRSDFCDSAVAFFTSQGTSGILDTGATKSVVGSNLVSSLLESLDPQVRKQIFRTSCNITFRFGNQGTLDSNQALVIPLSSIGLGLKIAIVQGNTPLLLSNTLLRTLKASLNSEHSVLTSPLLRDAVQLKLSPRGLYLMDLNELVEAQGNGKTKPHSAETYFSSSDNRPIETEKPDKADAQLKPHPTVPELHKTTIDTEKSHVTNLSATEDISQQFPSTTTDSRASGSSSVSDAFLNLVRHLETRHPDHEPLPALGSCPQDLVDRQRSQGLHGIGSARHGPDQSGIREGTCGSHICRDVGSRDELDQLVHKDLCREQQDGAPQDAHLCREEDRSDRSPAPRESARDSRRAGCDPSQEQSTGQTSISSRTTCGTGISPHERGQLGSGGTISRGISRDNRSSPSSHAADGGCDDRGVELCPSKPVSQSCMAGDIDHDFEEVQHNHTRPNALKEKFNRLVKTISQELQEVIHECQSSKVQPSLHLLEVFCNPSSELTKQVQNLGFRAQRHGFPEGDLDTKEGRRRLFMSLVMKRPRNLWYSPTCGPWSAWSVLNESKSIAMFDKVYQQRLQHLGQLALGLVLYRHQLGSGRHMHWEQPSKSLMFRSHLLSEILQQAFIAEFDMCNVGQLRDPENQMLYKKGMEIATTSKAVYENLHGRKCNHQHQHQPLEGSVNMKGISISRTTISENYPRKMARSIAKIITKIWTFRQQDDAFTLRTKRRTAAIDMPSKRVKLRETSLIEPEQMPAKRRRLLGKTSGEAYEPASICKTICDQVLLDQPRVGKKEIQDPDILRQIQNLFLDKEVVRAIACRGTERTIPPPKDMTMGEAPFRRAIIMQRQTKNILVENIWEEWEDLSYRQQWRRSHPSFLNITVFARNPENPVDNRQPSQPSDMHTEPNAQTQSQASDKPHMDSQSVQNNPETATGTSMSPETMTEIDVQSSAHGPKFRALTLEDRRILMKMHKNLGHPSAQTFSQVMKNKQYDETLVQAIPDMKCSVCQMQQKPKLQRPATLKDDLDFNDKVSMDGIKWTNKNHNEFHFYHFIDHGTNYHTAIIAPNKAAVMEKCTMGWLNTFGAPNEILMDSAREFVSEEFSNFLGQMNIKCHVVPPGAHWQMGRIERHGGVLQEMLNKFETEHEINTYQQLQQALTQCTMAKNSCGLRRGFSPDMLVFGRGLRTPGSITGDDNLPAHIRADEESGHGIKFREILAMRESARRAFHAADNSMALRRAALRRTRPHRGSYEAGEWVMVWKTGINQNTWIGPAKVVQQDANLTVFCNHLGNLIRAAPEHVRPVSAVEARIIPMENTISPAVEPQPQTDTRNVPQNLNIPESEVRPRQIPARNEPEIPNNNLSPDNPNRSTEDNLPPDNPHRPNSESSEQPDQEPELPVSIPNNSDENTQNTETQNTPVQPHEIAVPESDDELVCDILNCVDLDLQECHPEPGQVWRAEFDIDVTPDSHNMQNEAYVFLATAGKKERTEVKLHTLNTEEQKEFEKAKEKEINNWLQTGTVERMFRHQLSPEQILRCRWIYVWKPIECPKEQKELGKNKKAKARLVVLGYLDPQLETIPRDSPTLGRTSKMMIAQVVASMLWTLGSFDIRAAFLQGKTQEDRKIAVEPVPELIKAMKLQPDEVCRLVKSAYGLIDAPYLWFKELDRVLKDLGFISAPFDPCLYMLYHPKTQQPSGILGVHVDDGLCGGDAFFQSKIKELEAKFPFGSQKSQNFVFTGIEMRQLSDYSITMSQDKYVSKIEPIHIDPQRKAKLELAVTDQEKHQLRGLIGSLQYASVNTRPDLASRLSFLQSDINKATIATLIQANQVLHEAKKYKDTHIRIQPIPMNKVRFLAFSDASFASKKQPESHTGMIIMTTHEDIAKNHVCAVNPISWGCKKIQRVVTSTLSAETTSLGSTLDQLSWLRLYWAWINNPSIQWKKTTETLKQLPQTYATATIKEQPDIAVTDCKSLYDLVTRTAPPNCQEFRTQLQARAIKDMLAEGVNLRWVHSGAQLADALTKIMQSHFLRQTLKLGQYCLHDEQQVLKERQTARSRSQWLETTSQEQH